MSKTAYKFGRHGGHAGGNLREPFYDYVMSGEMDAPVVWGRRISIRELTGLLWNCTDIMPSEACEALDLLRGATYARGARHLRPFTSG